MDRTFLALGALLALFGVIFGAFGAHAVHGHVSPLMYSVYETAVHYQFYHALGLMLIGISAAQLDARGWLRVAGWLMFAGVILFSGSLYMLTLIGTRWLGILTPLGGTAFIVAWILYIVAILRSSR
ncbi:DUF423 domain-containing protein [Acidihalobacter prosperus]